VPTKPSQNQAVSDDNKKRYETVVVFCCATFFFSSPFRRFAPHIWGYSPGNETLLFWAPVIIDRYRETVVKTISELIIFIFVLCRRDGAMPGRPPLLRRTSSWERAQRVTSKLTGAVRQVAIFYSSAAEKEKKIGELGNKKLWNWEIKNRGTGK
jgi:hypothetical protein